MDHLSYKEYLNQRKEFLEEESIRYLGSDLKLNNSEEKVNQLLMSAKTKEIESAFKEPGTFPAGRHMFEVFNTVKDSKVYQIISNMPKGGVLHAHDTALLSTDKIVKFTYRDNLWICGDVFNSVPQFIFAYEKPKPLNGVEWISVAKERLQYKAEKYDKALRNLFTLYTEDAVTKYRDINVVWAKFMDLFAALDPIVCFVEVWKDYYYQALEEFYVDGVMYLEFRGILPEVSRH